MKWIVRILAGLGLAIAAPLVVLTLFLERGLKQAVEVVGSRIIQVAVRPDYVRVSPISGRVELEGLFIGNPTGYKSAAALEIASLRLPARLRSFFSERILIRTLSLSGPRITIEGGLQDNNLQAILNRVNETVEERRAARRRDRDHSDAPGQGLQVDELVLTGAQVELRMPRWASQPTTISLPAIRLTGLGQGSEGITSAELTEPLLRAILQAAAVAAAHVLPPAPDDPVGPVEDPAASAGCRELPWRRERADDRVAG